MLVAYVDESFTQSFFCFAGVVAGEHAIKDLSAKLDDLMVGAARNHGLSSNAEIHGSPLFQGKGVWSGLAPRVRVWLFERIVDAILESDVALLLRGVHTHRIREHQSLHDHTGRFSREHVCFEYLLQTIDHLASAHNTHALVIADDRDDRDRHREQFAAYKGFGISDEHKSTSLTRLLDTVYFTPSHPSRLLQAADILAFTYHRWMTSRERDARAHEVMARIKTKIVNSSNLNLPGSWP